jgi:ribosome recycling factor
MSEDIHDDTKEKIQELTKTYEAKVNHLAEAKEKEIMEQ